MKTTELIKLGVGDSFVMNRPDGPETCTITEIRKDKFYHQIDFGRPDGVIATIHVALPPDETEELGSVHPI